LHFCCAVSFPCSAYYRPEATFEHYRCTSLFEKLIGWLRSKGLDAEKPLHELRKEFGFQLANKHGIYVASGMLRHSAIQVTAAHYLDEKSRKTVGLGLLLKNGRHASDLTGIAKGHRRQLL
jgi:hypothetical protein